MEENKKYKAEKMALSRKKFDVIIDGNCCKINGNELLIFNKNLLKINKKPLF